MADTRKLQIFAVCRSADNPRGFCLQSGSSLRDLRERASLKMRNPQVLYTSESPRAIVLRHAELTGDSLRDHDHGGEGNYVEQVLQITGWEEPEGADTTVRTVDAPDEGIPLPAARTYWETVGEAPPKVTVT